MKFSKRWFQKVSDEVFYAEREPVRKKAIYEGDDTAWILLDMFNQEENRRLNERYEKEHPNGQARHREHGWYLPNDD